MKRIRTTFVSLVILLVSMTMVFGTVSATPTDYEPRDVVDEGPKPPVDLVFGTSGAEDDGTEGDPGTVGDGLGFNPGDVGGVFQPTDGVNEAGDGLTWLQLLNMLISQIYAVP